MNNLVLFLWQIIKKCFKTFVKLRYAVWYASLLEHYRHHWFPHAPCRGSGYRCLRINRKMDPLIGKAASAVGLTQEQLFSSLPIELTLWVDPSEVSYRIGEDGSICSLYKSSVIRTKSASSADTSAYRKEKLKTRWLNWLKGFNITEGSLFWYILKPSLYANSALL